MQNDVQNLTFNMLPMTIGALPSSYVDSMSYYETLLWLCNYLENTVIPAVNNNAEALTELQNAFIELHDYVEHYFDNLDVQTEINNKLDEMAQDGSLTNLIKAYVDPIYEAYETNINNQISNIETMVQNTLSGSPKGVYSTLSDLQTADPDHNYIYLVTANGNWYYYDGDSWESGGVYQASELSNNSIDYLKLKNNILKGQNFDYDLNKYNINSLSDISTCHLGFTASGVVSDSGYSRLANFGYMTFTNNPVFKLTDEAKNQEISYFVNVFKAKEKAENSLDFSDLNLESGSINNSGVNVSSAYNVRTSDYVTVETDTLFEPDINAYISYVYKYDSNNTYIERIDINALTPSILLTSTYKYKFVFKLDTYLTGALERPIEYYINFIKANLLTEMYVQIASGWRTDNLSYANSDEYYYKICLRKQAGSGTFIASDSVTDFILISDDLITPLHNKTISILGDSFSAYTGVIPAGNSVYYTGSNAGVSDVHQMWFQRLIDNNGATRGVIQASSGSNVSYIREQAKALSNEAMCENLGSPDVIIILGGTNDFSHTPALLGTFDGSQDFPTTNNDFSSAYALMLSRILATYPSATVFCCGIPAFVRTNLNKDQCEVNTETDSSHKTIFDYSEKIRQIASIMNCQYIDMNECGYNRENYYDTYCQDSNSNPTHPNAKGQEVIYRVIEKKVIDILNNLK